MYDFIRANQLDIMLGLSSACLCMALLLFITSFLEKRRKQILIFMEFEATLLLFFDRLAYIYAGDPSATGYVMVRVSNFFVFFLTPCIVFGFNLYLQDLLLVEGKLEKVPKRITFVSIISLLQMAIVVLSQITGLLYYFDENNRYHRSPGFAWGYVIPILCPIILYSVVFQYRHFFRKWIYVSLMTYIFVPIIMGIIQYYAYGLSITNISMVLVSISLYVYTYLDINETVKNAHNHEMKILEEEKKSAKLLFKQTASAFMTAVEQRDSYSVGHAKRVSELAQKLALMMGKNPEECEEIYYAALLHNIGLVGVPDELLDKKEKYSEEERKIIDRVPVLSSEILSGIVEYPSIKDAALYSHERYDGTGYPSGLKGEKIPEVARIVGVVDAYDAMTSRRSYRGPFPLQTIREELLKEAGGKFDPKIANLMVHLLDQENKDVSRDIFFDIEKEINCHTYRETVSAGIPIVQEITRINFKVAENETSNDFFSEPAILVFDSFDGFVHDNKKAIEAYHFLEYGEVWFDGRAITTSARNLRVLSVNNGENDTLEGDYEIRMAKYEDHVKLEMMSPKGKIDVIIALPDRSKAAYVSLTGENCRIYDIEVNAGDEMIKEGDIPKIVEADNYINRMESDLSNIQIDQYRSESTAGVPVEDKLKLVFHTMSLPSASLVWHCPYIVLYHSDDKRAYGVNYKEYAMIKINGEISADEGIVENKFSMKKSEKFPGWEVWKEKNKEGMECTVTFARKGNTITIVTENLGVAIENTTTILDGTKEIYVTLSGDQVALTDIRIG